MYHKTQTRRPVIASIGMLHGTVEDMEKQLVYANERAALYTKPGMLVCQSVVIEVAPRKGAGTSFRFPDKNVRKANMDLQRQHFPAGAVGTTSHFCGLPRGVTWAFKLCKPFMVGDNSDPPQPIIFHCTRARTHGHIPSCWEAEPHSSAPQGGTCSGYFVFMLTCAPTCTASSYSISFYPGQGNLR